MSRERFASSRADGRTNAEVILGVLAAVEPGTVITYEDFAAALAVGSDRAWDRRAVQSAVRGASRAILRTMARTLVPVVGVGYRLTRGSDHHSLAVRRETRATAQMRQALDVLKHAQFGEMTAQERTVHEAHLTITGALFQQVQLVTRRQRRQDDAIAALLSRVQRLEDGSAGGSDAPGGRGA